MTKRAYATLSGISLTGGILVAMQYLAFGGDTTFAGMAFTGLLGLSGTLAGRGREE